MILCLNVRDDNDNVLANVTLATNTRRHAAFHKALQRYASRECDDCDFILFQIYRSMYVPISFHYKTFSHSYCINKVVQFFAPQCISSLFLP